MTASPHVMSLGWETDQYDLRTRVKVRGPLTTLKNAWSEVWRTSKFHLPVGLWYDPTDSANLRVLDRGTKRLYKLRQSDRVILSSVYLGAVCAHPLGLSGDPASSTVYWVLEAPWRTTGVSTNNKILKLRKSDNVVLARWAIPNGRWSAIKVSSSYIWLTNLDTDKVYKRSKTDGSSIASYSITYNAVAQTNPSGLMIDGSTLYYFFANSGTTARFLQASESAPQTIVGVIKTAGTQLHGGEMDTTTHVDCYGDSDSLGLVAKFTLKTPVTNDVAQEAIDTDLEDELGALAQIGDRIHDSHPLDAAHPFQVRRETMDIPEVTSLAQAMQVAQDRLAELAKRREVLDIGIVGNPALQKSDLVSVDDPLVGITVYGRIDTLETDMSADQPYVGVAAVIPQDVTIDDGETVGDPSVDDGSIDEDGTPDTTDPGSDDTTWFGLADPWAGRPAFGTYDEAPAGQMWISGDQHGAVIEQLTFSSRAAGVNVIVLDGVSNLTLRDLDFDTVPECIYINGGGDGLVIERIRAANIFGPYTRTGFHSGNLIQANNPGPMKLRDLKVVQPDPEPGGYTAWGTEDIISLGGNTTWGGTAMTDDDALIVERFAFDGGDWQSPSGTGLFVGDGDLTGGHGQYVWVRDGTLLNPAQCAIGTGEQGPYRFERIDIEGSHGGENTGLQLRTASLSLGDVRVDWPTTAESDVGYTDLGGNNFAASLTLSVTL
jgi:hypothetical protein